MPTNTNPVPTSLDQLKLLATRAQQQVAALSSRVDDLVTAGGEPNKIEKIQVNGVELEILDGKIVNVVVPTKVGDLTNDQEYQTATQMATAIQTAISKTGHASFQKVDAVPAADAAEENILYLVMNADTGHYDIYALIGESVELLDDTTVDLTAYATTAEMTTALTGKVDKEDGKGLSTNDYTDAEKAKLSGVAEGATKVEASETNGNVKINGVETAVVTFATDAEVTAMLDEVFGTTETA